MAQIAALTLNDGQATPVAKTFSPTVASLNESRWIDKTTGRLVGIPTIVLKSQLPGKTSPHFKVTAEVALPVMETVSNANAQGYVAPPQEAYRVKFLLTAIMPARSGVQERKDGAAFMRNLMNNAQFLSLISDFEQPF